MALTITNKEQIGMGNKLCFLADVTFDSSYDYGGESINALQQFGINRVDGAFISSSGGYSFALDRSTNTIKAYGPALMPPIVYEEKVTLSDTVGTLRYPAAFIMNVARSGNNKKLRSTGLAIGSLGDDQCCLVSQMTDAKRTQIRVKDYDRLAGDGAFTGGTTNWTFNAAPWTYGTNNLVKDADGTNALTHDTFAAVAGRTYRVAYTISGTGTTGTFTTTLGGAAGTTQTMVNGTFTEDITATGTTGISMAPSNAARFTLDSVTIHDLSEPVYVTYVTQAWRDVWNNLVQDETLTLATGANTLASGNKILALMYVDQTTATAAALTMIDVDDTVASGEVDVAFNSATGQFTVHSDQNAKAIKTTYIKVPASGFLADRAFTNEGGTKAGGDPYTNTFDYPILLWGYAGCMPINGGTTQVLIDYAGTPAAGEAVIDWFTPGIRGAGAPATGTVVGTKSDVTGTAAGVWGVIDEIPPAVMEVPDGTDLSGITTRIMILGG